MGTTSGPVRMAMAQSSKWARRYGDSTYLNAGTNPGGAEET